MNLPAYVHKDQGEWEKGAAGPVRPEAALGLPARQTAEAKASWWGSRPRPFTLGLGAWGCDQLRLSELVRGRTLPPEEPLQGAGWVWGSSPVHPPARPQDSHSRTPARRSGCQKPSGACGTRCRSPSCSTWQTWRPNAQVGPTAGSCLDHGHLLSSPDGRFGGTPAAVLPCGCRTPCTGIISWAC